MYAIRSYYATLAALMIEAAVGAVDPELPDGYITVGQFLEITHVNPTIEGMTVTVDAKIIDRITSYNVCYTKLLRSRNLSKDPEGVGCTLAENINNSISEDCRGLFMFPDFNFNFDRLLTSFQENLDRKEFFPVWGAVRNNFV